MIVPIIGGGSLPTFNPLDVVSGIQVWLDPLRGLTLGESNVLLSATEQSANATVIAPSTGNEPIYADNVINGKSMLDFNNHGHVVSGLWNTTISPAIPAGPTGVTFIAVVNLPDLEAPASMIVGSAPISDLSYEGGISLWNNLNWDGLNFFTVDSNGSPRELAFPYPTAIDMPWIIMLEYNPSKFPCLFCWINNYRCSAVDGQLLVSPVGIPALPVFTVGGDIGTSGIPGFLGDAFYINKLLSASEKSYFNSGLAARSGATLLPDQDIPTVAVATDISDCLLWVEAGADTIIRTPANKACELINCNGSDENMMGGTGGKLPAYEATGLNGKPTLGFDGTGNFAAFAPSIGSLTHASLVTLSQCTDQDTQRVCFSGYLANGSGFILGHVLNGGRLYVTLDGNHYGSVAFTSSDPTIVTILYDGEQSTNADRLRLRINGVDQTLSFNAGIASSTSAIVGLMMGITQGENFWKGTISVAGFYTKTLSPSEITTVETYVGTKM